MSEIHRPIADFTAETLDAGKRPISIAGDCCTSIGMVAGIQRSGINPTLLWFDAHGDFNTWETSPSGFLGGMPLAMLVGRGEQTLLEALGASPLPESQVILTDARDLDVEEKRALDHSDVSHIPDVQDLLQSLPKGPLYIHFDCDIVRSKDIPSVSYPASGGPTAETFQHILAEIAVNANVVAVSLASWDPTHEQSAQSQKTCMDLLYTLIQ
jgi:arginase